VPSYKKHVPKRAMKDLYQKFRWATGIEKKWQQMIPAERLAFAQMADAMCSKHQDIHLHGITVKKENVEAHIRNDCNKLYNYMIRLCVLECMSKRDHVVFIPDPRSIKVQSGNSLHDYLQTELWFTLKVKTTLATTPLDSKNCLGIQFADMLAGLIQQRFEDRQFGYIRMCIRRLRLKRLFFK
jgi:hypothetical protein